MFTSTALALWISVRINGEEYEAIPQVFDTVAECLQEEKLYTKDIVIESKCFTVDLAEYREIGIK